EDKAFAITSFAIHPTKCSTVTYGIETESKKVPFENKEFKKRNGFDEAEKILLFNGTLDYQPNGDAVKLLILKIDPLISRYLSDYRIVITGNRITAALENSLKKASHFVYKGFVEEVADYYMGANLFLNPVLNNTGVKTKVIEAIANHCTVITTLSGAGGIRKELCGEKLIVVEDSNWNNFAHQVIRQLGMLPTQTPDPFFDYYSWNNIIQHTVSSIHAVVTIHA
ncbi:MAG TPA: glycosyltransferase family 4 protein, partial [Chitinophagaceae bacterium]|nr:glycosyltransferase family 4 protein [Chitinophagaceae bacterium]